MGPDKLKIPEVKSEFAKTLEEQINRAKQIEKSKNKNWDNFQTDMRKTAEKSPLERQNEGS